jgi:hypothetical protein
VSGLRHVSRDGVSMGNCSARALSPASFLTPLEFIGRSAHWGGLSNRKFSNRSVTTETNLNASTQVDFPALFFPTSNVLG